VKKRKCRDCREWFTPTPNKPGYVNQCANCATDVEKVMAEVSWENKHTPIINVTTRKKAVKFNNSTKRFGAGVTKAIAPSFADFPSEHFREKE
jgi:hypothetical protein